MKRAFLLLFLLVSGGNLAGGAEDGPEQFGVLVCATVTEVGSRRPMPDPELNPVYYRLITHGYVPFGREVLGDPAPDRERLLSAVVASLRPHGLLPADDAHPPRLVIGVVWGSIFDGRYAKTEFLRSPVVRMKWRPSPHFEAPYDTAWAQLPTKLADRYRSIMVDDLVVFSLTAYDYANAARGVEIPFWQTRVMASLRGSFAERRLPGMIKAATSRLAAHEPLPRFETSPAVAWADLADADPMSDVPPDLVVHDHGSARFR